MNTKIVAGKTYYLTETNRPGSDRDFVDRQFWESAEGDTLELTQEDYELLYPVD